MKLTVLNKLTALSLLFILFFGSSAYAQFTLSGQVKDKINNSALFGASVLLQNTDKGSATNSDGSFSISNINSGSYTLKVSYVGYKDYTETIRITSDKSITIQLEPSVQAIEQVTVRAIRADELAPISQKTIPKQEIEKAFIGEDGAFVLEKLSPSIQVNSESGTRFTNYGSMRLRGIDQKRINITLNGVPLNDMVDQGVYFSNFTDFTNSIESVQVQRGVGTSTNGTASYAGSISYESVKINTEEPETTLQLVGGSYNTIQGSVELKSGLLDNNTAFYARMSKTYSDGYRDHTGTDSYSMFFSGGYFGEKDVIKINGFTGRTKNDLGYSPVPASLVAADPKTNINSVNDIDDFGQSLIQLEHSHFFTPDKSLVSSIYYGAAGGDFPYGYTTTDNIYSVSDQGDTTYNQVDRFEQINYPLYNDHYGLMSYYTEEGTALDWSVGIHAYRFNRENIEEIVPNYANPYYQDETVKNEVSGFLKGSYRLNDLTIFGDIQARSVGLQLHLDASYLGSDRSIPEYSWFFINPKVGVTYEFTNQLNAYASFGRSGREPNRSDYVGDTQINGGNIDRLQDQESVKAEFVNDFELGFRLNTESSALNANFFYMAFENEIAPIGAYIDQYFLQIYENQESSYRTGIELDWKYNIISWLDFTGNATYMNSIISEYTPEGSSETLQDIKTPYSPEVFLNAGLTAGAGSDLSVTISTRYVGKSYTELTNNEDFTLPAYALLNMNISFDIIDNINLRVDLNNLTNEEYYTDGGPVESEMGYFVQAPRNAYLTLTAKF